MKFVYCPKCRTLTKQNWYTLGRCAVCGEDIVRINIRTGLYGWLMYIFSIAAAMLLVTYIIDYDIGLGPDGVYLVFVILLVSYIFAYLELIRAEKEAKLRVQNIRH